MTARNKRLTPELALHLAGHGVKKNSDGTYSWKFDNYQRVRAPYPMSVPVVEALAAAFTKDGEARMRRLVAGALARKAELRAALSALCLRVTSATTDARPATSSALP